jgi:hypothetical protein
VNVPSKEHILREIRRTTAENGGTAIGVKRFTQITGITEWQWMGRYWARWSDAVREAGHEPGVWNAKTFDDDDLLRILAELTREFGRLPTVAEMSIRKQTHPEMPGADQFRRRLGEKAVLRDRLLAWSDARPDFADVAAICVALPGAASRPKVAPSEDHGAGVVIGVVYLVRMGEFYKIGKSNDPGRRSYELGLRLPEKHDVVHVIETDDPSGIEAYWHRRFAAQRANGEWFRLAPGDIAAFRRRSYM